LLGRGDFRRWRDDLATWNRFGVTGTLLALIVSSWWMLPRALDGVLSSRAMELLKFVTVPLLVGGTGRAELARAAAPARNHGSGRSDL
jgi:hypothetical protein